ncbi:site-specific integrase [Halapricum desulfuricans]|uniref:XerD/XerC family integrase n=1 Tax=Halapricum desulfuricans TaxID=2841257 RepID=A0A897NA00_9EURY|nr:site-specific integrase [Halapricum desulfuricans]QSG09527.1 XerD/XerC family integrase [Halapricum desulfuricans]
MPETTLEPIAPDEAVRLYLRDRQNELADATIDSYRYKLEKFVDWCETEDLENLNSLSGRDLLRFKQYRAQDLNSVSLKGQLDALRAFVKWCESIDAVEQDLHNKVLSPSLNDGDRERDVLLDSDAATDILDHLARFEGRVNFGVSCDRRQRLRAILQLSLARHG